MAAKAGGGGGRRPRGFPEVRNKRLKEEAVAFYSRHDVPGAIERLLNEMYPAAPSDVYGYMVETNFKVVSLAGGTRRLASNATNQQLSLNPLLLDSSIV